MTRKMISVLLYLGNFLKTVHPKFFLSEHLLEVGSRVQCIYINYFFMAFGSFVWE